MNTIELVCWEKATPAHHPRQHEFVFLHCIEDQYPFPQVIMGYWTDAAEGYYSLLDDENDETVKVDYWAKLPGGPRERH